MGIPARAANKAHRQEAAALEAWLRVREVALRALDGVPLLVKDVLDVRGLPTRMGTRFVVEPVSDDATAVARLREAGAVLLGKATMTELGISPLGASGHQRLPHNPHARGRAAGGSSTGSAVAVALGIVPLSTGAPPIPERATDGGAADGEMVAALCRLTFMANLTGVPAGTVPVGVDRQGVPIGLQLVGDAGDEAGVLAVMAHLERLGFTARCAPGALDLLA